MDLIAYVPEFNLYNQDWPIYTMSGNLPPAKFVHAGRDRLGHATDSIVSPGVIVSGGEVHHSVLSPMCVSTRGHRLSIPCCSTV